MIATEQIKQLTSKEKLMAIEAIWDELLSASEHIESPAWHAEVLQETKSRVDAGLEQAIDWEQAKAKLRKEFE